ncbi:MAG: response regulator [Firmicutes bacterium HGW-Firmicutes-15]|nr:MAG: response regulator [Firmicutes bacterium HGW-Firmicutes-15]
MVENNEFRILLVEDDPGDAELIREGLRDAKILIDLQAVDDGIKALKYLRHEHPYEKSLLPDIILLDLNLPKKDGREVLGEIKSDPLLRRIPVVVLTTSDAEIDIIKSYTLGANCYITKPVNLDGFLKVVQTIEGFWLTVVRLPYNSGEY